MLDLKELINLKNLSISIVLYNNDIEDIKMVLNGCFETVANKDVYIIDHSDKASFLIILNRKVNYLKSKNTGFGSGHNKPCIILNFIINISIIILNLT